MDLKQDQQVVARCLICERTTRFLPGTLQRLYRVPSDTLVYDLQFRLRCKNCNSQSGVEVVVMNARNRPTPNAE